MITKESNSQRKSHRVELPLHIQIGDDLYPAKDWSTSGVGITGLKKTPDLETIIPANLIFPMVGSTLTLAVSLVFKAQKGNISGFEFHELSSRNKRVLRHYVELAVEGRLENIEDVVAIAAMPSVASPIDDALNLTDLESEGIVKEFKKKSYLAIFLGVLLLLTVASLLFYNTVYKIEVTGFVSGNIERITANSAGRVRTILVKTDSYVEKNTPLFFINDVNLDTDISGLNQRIKQLSNTPVPMLVNMQLLASLRKELAQRKIELNNAKHLYQKRIISQKDFFLARNRHSQIQTAYLRETTRNSDKSAAKQNADLLRQLRLELGAKNSLRGRQSNNGAVRAHRRGKIFQIDKNIGEFVIATDSVILLESDVTPHVLIRLRNEDVLKLHLGMKADIFVPFEERTHQAVISAIGHTAANADVTDTIESSKNETVVKLEFLDQTVRLPANARVKVWIKTLGSV